MNSNNTNQASGINYPGSYYAWSANEAPQRPALEGDVEADVCIIGAGYSGLSTGLHLAEKGYKVVMLEEARVGWGASGRNGGQIVNGFSRDLDSIEKSYGTEPANAIGKWILEGGDIIRSRIEKYDIKCDLKQGNIFTAFSEKQMREFESKIALWKRHGMDHLELLDKNELRKHVGSNVYVGGLRDPRGGHIHPLNLALGEAAALEANGGVIYEQTRVTSIKHDSRGGVAHTANGQVRAKKLVVCGNAYLGNAVPELTSKVMPVSTQIIATEPLTEQQAQSILPSDHCVEDSNYMLDYFRLSGDRRLLFGGGSTYGGAEPSDIIAKLQPHVKKVFPQLEDVKFDFAWSGNFALTVTRIPHMGKMGDNVYFVHGYSGHGVTGTHTCGKILAEAIDGDTRRFDVWANMRYFPFPGGRIFRVPAMVVGSWWYIMRDKLGI